MDIHNGVPCEYCGDIVIHQLYNQHVYRCSRSHIMQLVQDDDNYFDNVDDYHDLRRYLTHNSQVHRVNIRDFIETHRSPTSVSPVYNFHNYYNRHHSNEISQSNINSDNIDVYESFNVNGVIQNVKIKDLNTISVIISSHVQCEEEICPICQNELNSILHEGRKVRRLECFHIFCDICIDKWFDKHNTCPICLHVYDI